MGGSSSLEVSKQRLSDPLVRGTIAGGFLGQMPPQGAFWLLCFLEGLLCTPQLGKLPRPCSQGQNSFQAPHEVLCEAQ